MKLNEIEYLRFVLCKNCVSAELHGFSDVSEITYGACIFYIRTVDSLGTISVNLIVAKTRVSPLKASTILRLELSAVVLLSKLLKRINDSLNINFNSIILWCDSNIELSWIQKDPIRLKQFDANRVGEI